MFLLAPIFGLAYIIFVPLSGIGILGILVALLHPAALPAAPPAVEEAQLEVRVPVAVTDPTAHEKGDARHAIPRMLKAIPAHLLDLAFQFRPDPLVRIQRQDPGVARPASSAGPADRSAAARRPGDRARRRRRSRAIGPPGAEAGAANRGAKAGGGGEVDAVRPGRNLTSIIEVAARNFVLKGMGYHPAREFHEKLLARMECRPLGDEVE